MAKVSGIPEDVVGMIDRLREEADHLLSLPMNWDSYHADKINNKALMAALFVKLVPLPDGGVSMAWEGEKATVEFDSEGRLRGVCWDREG